MEFNVLQSFMFGDFDDLAPDEHQRIQNILHGYKEPSLKKVEVGGHWSDIIFNILSSPELKAHKVSL